MKILGNNETYYYTWLEEDIDSVLSELAYLCDKFNITNIHDLRGLIDDIIGDR